MLCTAVPVLEIHGNIRFMKKKSNKKAGVESGSKLWVNTLWPSLNGGYDDNAAYEATDPGEIYDVILGLGTSIIQTDRPEMLIKYLEKK